MAGRRRRARRGLTAGLALAVAAMTGCEMQVDVGVDVDRDGSGQVAVAVDLDAEAAGNLPDLATQLRLDDLEAAGWMIDGPTPGQGGSVAISATKAFASPEEANGVLREVGGGDGPFRELEVARRSSFLSTDYTFTGAVDLSAGVAGFGDKELRQRLEGSGFNLETAQLEEVIGAPVEDTFRFQVRATLPGSVSVDGTGSQQGDTAVWAPAVGERTALVATSEVLHRQRLVWLGTCGAALVALAAILVHERRRRRS